LLSFPLALLFLPVLGALSVGQYDFPVLLGTSLLIYSLRKEHVTLTVLGILLLTFKPHIGALILVSGLVYLIAYKSDFGRRLLRPLIMAVVILLVTGLIADPVWIVRYPRMLLTYQSEGNVSTCSECASLPVWLSRWFFDGSLTTAAWIAIALLALLLISLYFVRHFLKSHELLLSAALLITLLVSPYLYNYDFLLLLVPLAVIAREGSLLQKITLLPCYFVPTFALLLYGRDGNISLILVSVVIASILYIRANHPIIDFPARAA